MRKNVALNGICPYFTMFPLDFPYSILNRYASAGHWVIDPFCGRGTTNYASRILGLPSIGIDSSIVAIALSQAKLANTSPQLIIQTAQRILDEVELPRQLPEGEFWEWAFHKDVLYTVCRLREGLLSNCRSDSRKALRAIIMGALHGPQPKSRPFYLSNQSPRTYAPKPRYAVGFWKSRGLLPPPVDVIKVIEERAYRYYSGELAVAVGKVIRGDSRRKSVYRAIGRNKIKWVITSPPYYGIRTYIPDQWLRLWFLGGQPTVDYSTEGQLRHSSPDEFTSQLKQVWQNVGSVCVPRARLIIRFGAINDRKVDPLLLIRQSLKDSGWKIKTTKPAGSASKGRRQAWHFSFPNEQALEEYDVWAMWEG